MTQDDNESTSNDDEDTDSGIDTESNTDRITAAGGESIPRSAVYDTFVDDDIPSQYSVIASLPSAGVTVVDGGVLLDDNGNRSVNIQPEYVPYSGRMIIDYFYNRPVLYLYTPGEEDVQYVIALPTVDDPVLRPLSHPHNEFPRNRDIVTE